MIRAVPHYMDSFPHTSALPRAIFLKTQHFHPHQIYGMIITKDEARILHYKQGLHLIPKYTKSLRTNETVIFGEIIYTIQDIPIF